MVGTSNIGPEMAIDYMSNQNPRKVRWLTTKSWQHERHQTQNPD